MLLQVLGRDGRYWQYFDISRYQNFTILVSILFGIAIPKVSRYFVDTFVDTTHVAKPLIRYFRNFVILYVSATFQLHVYCCVLLLCFLLFYGSSAWNKDWLIDWLIDWYDIGDIAVAVVGLFAFIYNEYRTALNIKTAVKILRLGLILACLALAQYRYTLFTVNRSDSSAGQRTESSVARMQWQGWSDARTSRLRRDKTFETEPRRDRMKNITTSHKLASR